MSFFIRHPVKLKTVVGIILSLATAYGLGTTVLEGNVYVQVVASVYTKIYDNGTCYSIDTEVVQNVEAIKWSLTKLNDANFIPESKIGMRVSETCRSIKRAEMIASDLAYDMKLSPNLTIIGVIGAAYSSETEVISRLLSSLPEKYRLLQIGYSATSESLKNKDIYRNYFRTIASDSIQVEVTQAFVETFNWTYVAVVYEDNVYGRGAKTAFLDKLKIANKACVPVQVAFDPNNNISLIEETLSTKVIAAPIPVAGMLIFGSYIIADAVLKATENILERMPNVTRPVFLLSEAGGYIEGHQSNISKGIYVLNPPKKTIMEFQDYWTNTFSDMQNAYNTSLTPPWLRDFYNENFKCELAKQYENNTCMAVLEEDFEQKIPASMYNQYAIQATFVMSKVFQIVNKRNCGGPEICDAVYTAPRRDFIQVMNNLTVTFDNDFADVRIPEFREPNLVVSFRGLTDVSIPEIFPLYELYNHQVCDKQSGTTCFVKVADFSHKNGLIVHKSKIKDYDGDGNEYAWPNLRTPVCPDGYFCASCSDRNRDTYLLVPGDLYIVAIVPIHDIGPTPLQCGDINQGGLDVAEAVRFAVAEAKSIYKTRIPDAEIGVVIIDSCNDPQIAQEKILSMQRRGVFGGSTALSQVKDKILGYIGGWTSDVSMAMAAITTRLRAPQIAYGATADVLSSRTLYPYFVRVPTPDNKQAMAILKIVKELGSNLIQLVFSKTSYGEGGRDNILREAHVMGICVAENPIDVSDFTTSSDLVSKLRLNSDVKTVVLFINSYQIKKLIKGLNDDVSQHEFLFIASEGWGTRIKVNKFKKLLGTITVSSELSINEKFKDHMKKLKPDGSNIDLWIRPYMENYFQCYYKWSYNKTSGQKCTGLESLDAHTSNYKIEAWSPFIEKAVMTLLFGAKQALDFYCGGSTTLCEELRNNTSEYVNFVKKQKLLDDNQCMCPVYNVNGDGLAGYHIYVVTLGTDSDYKKIGSSNGGGFTFDTNIFVTERGRSVQSTCGKQDYCKLCFPDPVTKDVEGLSIGVIVVIAILGGVCCILSGTLLYICNMQGCCIKIENGRLRHVTQYITPMYNERRSSYADGMDNYVGIGQAVRQGDGSSGGRDSNQRSDATTRGDSSSHGDSAGKQSDATNSQPQYLSMQGTMTSHPDYMTPSQTNERRDQGDDEQIRLEIMTLSNNVNLDGNNG